MFLSKNVILSTVELKINSYNCIIAHIALFVNSFS